MFQNAKSIEIENPENSETIDQNLVRLATQGDVAAFEKLITTYQTQLWNYINSFLENYDDSCDAVQQTIMQSFSAISRLRDPTRFRSWLFRIARNVCIDRLRLRSVIVYQTELEADELTATFTDFDALPAEIIERQEMQQIMQRLIAELPPLQRSIVTLRYAADLSFAEIAEIMEMNESTLRNCFLRCKQRLYIRLEAYL